MFAALLCIHRVDTLIGNFSWWNLFLAAGWIFVAIAGWNSFYLKESGDD